MTWGKTLLSARTWRLLRALAQGGEEIHWAAHDYNLKAMLPLISYPTLVLIGTKDQFYRFAERVKNLVPNSKFTIIENCPIRVDRVMPKEFAGAILSFVKVHY